MLCTSLHTHLHTAHVQCMYASTYCMQPKHVAVLLAGTSESDDALSQKVNVSTQHRPRYRKTINYSFNDLSESGYIR